MLRRVDTVFDDSAEDAEEHDPDRVRISQETGGYYHLLELQPFGNAARNTLISWGYRDAGEIDGHKLWTVNSDPHLAWSVSRRVHQAPAFAKLAKKIFWTDYCGCTKRMIRRGRDGKANGWRADTYCTAHDPMLKKERALVERDQREEQAGMSLDDALERLRVEVETCIFTHERLLWTGADQHVWTDGMKACAASLWPLSDERSWRWIEETLAQHHSIVRLVRRDPTARKGSTDEAYHRLEVVDRGFGNNDESNIAAATPRQLATRKPRVYAFIRELTGDVYGVRCTWMASPDRNGFGSVTYARSHGNPTFNAWDDPESYRWAVRAEGLITA